MFCSAGTPACPVGIRAATKVFCALTLFFLAGCGPKTPPAPEHFAILRFENLSPDASTDWMGRAFAVIITAELPAHLAIPSVRVHAMDRTLGARPVSAPGISTERTGALFAGANRIGYGDYAVRNGRIEARLTVEDPQTGRMTAVLTTSAPDILTAAGDLARGLSPQATAYETRSVQAVEDYSNALESPDAARMAQNAATAIAADPNFVQAYRLLSDARMQQHDRDGALAALDQALAHGGGLSAVERFRIEFQAATLRQDFAAGERALAGIAKANPGDADSWRALAQAAYARHDYPGAVEAYRKLLQIVPNDGSALNEFGYSQAYNGDLDGALASLRRYQALNPKDANSLDSQGDVNLMYGRLSEAGNLYLQADQLDRKRLEGGDLFKAAMARLMAGDVPGASALDRQFIEARAALHDPEVPVHQAEWLWISGDRKSAEDQLRAVTAPAIASRANVDLAIWSLLEGDRSAAAQWSAKAGAAMNQSTAVEVLVARFISLPSASAAEWATRADQLFRNVAQPEFKDLTLAYALLFDRHFAEAAETLRRVYAGPSPDPGIPVLLAWSLIEAGHPQEAAPLLRLNPIPLPSGVGSFTPIYYPRLLELRKKLAGR